MTLLLRSRSLHAALLAAILFFIVYSLSSDSSFPKYIHSHLSMPTGDGSQLIDITRPNDAAAGLETAPTNPSRTIERPATDEISESTRTPTPTMVDSTLPPIDSNVPISTFVQEIMTYNTSDYARLTCPPTIGARYSDLPRRPSNASVKYFFALNLYKVAPLLPRLMSTIIENVRFLGPSNCAISIIEGRSDDNTYPILDALRPELAALGTHFYLDSTPIDPHGEGVDRIKALAMLRNLALQPLVDNSASLFGPDTIIAFLNDIAVCPEDILELLYQHTLQNATQTCAFDWIANGECFYDVWVSRSMAGNIFFEVTQTASWDYHENLFWDDPVSAAQFAAHRPLQVYSCWGGMVTLSPAPFLAKTLTFRASQGGECYMGEPTTLAKDMWRAGEARILAVPAVNVGYSNEETEKIKARRGYVADHVDVTRRPGREAEREARVQWRTEPPAMVKCLPNWDKPSWVSPV